MKLVCLGVAVCLAASGCKPKAEPGQPVQSPNSANLTQGARGTASAVAGGSNDGSTVTPIGPNIGPITPVAGGENLGGESGGSVGQMAKEQAKKAADQSATSTATDTADQ